ncbi:MAG: RNA polymerase sigma factor [SAR324 cluster bacterium]|nr:RNA polymerase sigma factor [SAR324 cluster bacterium]
MKLFKKNNSLSDQELINLILAGDSSAFELLVNRFQNKIFRFILRHVWNRHEAEDLTQETFVSAFTRLSGYEARSQLSTWLFGIAYNKVLQHHRQSPGQNVEFVSEEILEEQPSLELTPSEKFEKDAMVHDLNRFIDQLPDDLKTVLILVSFEGCSYDEVAEIMKIPAGTVKSKMFRAREVLKTSYKQIRPQ